VCVLDENVEEKEMRPDFIHFISFFRVEVVVVFDYSNGFPVDTRTVNVDDDC
jgi:hypothetical protein